MRRGYPTRAHRQAARLVQVENAGLLQQLANRAAYETMSLKERLCPTPVPFGPAVGQNVGFPAMPPQKYGYALRAYNHVMTVKCKFLA